MPKAFSFDVGKDIPNGLHSKPQPTQKPRINGKDSPLLAAALSYAARGGPVLSPFGTKNGVCTSKIFALAPYLGPQKQTLLAFTTWRSRQHTRGGIEHQLPLRALYERLLHESDRGIGGKQKAPTWAPIRCGGRATNEAVRDLSCFVVDYDGGTLDIARVADQLAAVGAAFIAHDSPSATPDFHKWRLCLPLIRPAEPARWSELYLASATALAGLLLPEGQSFDPSCQNPGRRWFVPWRQSSEEERRRVFTGEGLALDLEAFAADYLATHPLPTPSPTPRKSKKRTSPPPRPRPRQSLPPDAIERAKRYLATMDPAISHQWGHNQTFRAARTLVVDFDLDPQTALRLLQENFNPRCLPPWTEKELRHKVEDADRLSGPRGRLLRESRRKELPPHFAAQLKKAPKTSAAPKTPTRSQAAPHIQQAIREGLERPDTLRVVVVPCAGGKSQAVLDLLHQESTPKETEKRDPLPVPLALLVREHELAEDLRARAEKLGIRAARYFSPPGQGGPRHPAPEGKRKGDRKCIKPLSTIEAHLWAGVAGHKICQGCPQFDQCEAKPGRIGSEKALLHIAPDQSPTLATQHAHAVIKDEWPELYRLHVATQKGLRMLALGDLSLMPETRRVLKDAANDVLLWADQGAPLEQDPLLPHREALKALTLQDDGHRRTELARDPAYRPNRHQENQGALAYAQSWQAATTLIRAALAGATLRLELDHNTPRFVFSQKSPVAEALTEAKSAVILTATPGDLDELAKVTGKKVEVVTIPIAPLAKIEQVWKPDQNATRRGYMDRHGRPRWGTPQDKKKTSLAQHIQDTTSWLSERPLARSLLLGTYLSVALGIRLAWARFRNLPPDPQDWDAWQKLHTSKNADRAIRHALRVLSPLFFLLLERNITLDVIWYHAGAGLNRWREQGNAFDACATLGNPNPSLKEHRRRYAQARDIDEADLAKDDPGWQTAYHAAAAAEAGQTHGRLGDIGRPEDAPAWHLHIGKTLPHGWDQNTVSAYRPPGRPRRPDPPAPPGEDWRDALTAALQEAGSFPALARVLGISERSLRRYHTGERAPDSQLLDQLRARGGLAKKKQAQSAPDYIVVGRTEITPAIPPNVFRSNFGPTSGEGAKHTDVSGSFAGASPAPKAPRKTTGAPSSKASSWPALSGGTSEPVQVERGRLQASERVRELGLGDVTERPERAECESLWGSFSEGGESGGEMVVGEPPG